MSDLTITELNTMFNTNELRLIEEAIENYGSRCS